MHAGKLVQVINFTIVRGTAKHCVDQYMVLFRYYLLGGDTTTPSGLYARLCHAFLVIAASLTKFICERRAMRVNTVSLSQKSINQSINTSLVS